MYKIDTKVLLLKIFAPAVVFSLSYLVLGLFCSIPHILLFCILGTVILLPLWKTLLIAFVFFGVAGLLSAFVAPLENQIFAQMRTALLNRLPIGFDWTNYEALH